MNAGLVVSVIAAVFLATSGAALAATCSGREEARGLVANDVGVLVAIGDTNHVRDPDNGPPGLNLDGENGRPGYGYGDPIHGEHDDPPPKADEGDFPGWGGPPQ